MSSRRADRQLGSMNQEGGKDTCVEEQRSTDGEGVATLPEVEPSVVDGEPPSDSDSDDEEEDTRDDGEEEAESVALTAEEGSPFPTLLHPVRRPAVWMDEIRRLVAGATDCRIVVCGAKVRRVVECCEDHSLTKSSSVRELVNLRSSSFLLVSW